jgi:hypothetical protein
VRQVRLVDQQMPGELAPSDFLAERPCGPSAEASASAICHRLDDLRGVISPLARCGDKTGCGVDAGQVATLGVAFAACLRQEFGQAFTGARLRRVSRCLPYPLAPNRAWSEAGPSRRVFPIRASRCRRRPSDLRGRRAAAGPRCRPLWRARTGCKPCRCVSDAGAHAGRLVQQLAGKAFCERSSRDWRALEIACVLRQ